jgi:putative glutamine amidotransferase
MPQQSPRLRVGVTESPKTSSRTRQNYLDAVLTAGMEPVSLTSADRSGLDLLRSLAGLVLTGGGDLNPALYGQSLHPKTTSVDDERDSLELEAFRRAKDIATPILAICRGFQVVNVALGGSLEQHVEGHRTPEGKDPKMYSGWHELTLAPGSVLAGTLGSERVLTNSRHHQAVRPENMAAGLTPIAWSDDGLIEGFEAEGVLGVQWHPERMNDPDAPASFKEQSQRLFQLFARTVSQAAAVTA